MRTTTVALVLLTLPAFSLAQPFDSMASINLILSPAQYSGCGAPAFDFIEDGDCQSLADHQNGIPNVAFLFVVASRETGFPSLGAVQFGIEHNGVQGWTLCTGGAEIPQAPGWPDSGTGNIVAWPGGCYTPANENAKLGFFSVPDGNAVEASVVLDPRLQAALWIDCGAPPDVPPTEFEIPSCTLGSLSRLLCDDRFCGTPTVQTSWGAIKSLY